MGKIKLLPEDVINQIAAGEVVQRPASVVKELMENSIDAKAKNISVIIEKAGKNLIQVIDDGVGMEPEDARLCFERHATSKIKSIEDIYKLHSLGFRGEALASIASVANVELRTRPHNKPLGTLVNVQAGKILKYEQINTPAGTNLKVKHLFFNIPARRNFLRSDNTEFKHILNIFIPISLSYPEISFSLKHNNKLVFQLPKKSLKGRITDLFPDISEEELLPVEINKNNIKIYGFIGSPKVASQKRNNYLFVNNRYIRSPLIHKTVVENYSDMIEKEAQPFYVLFININPEEIDVNVHPTKTEIKFEDYYKVSLAVKESILQTLGIKPLFIPESPKNILKQSKKTATKFPTKPFIENFPAKSRKETDVDWKNFIENHLKPKDVIKTQEIFPTENIPQEDNEIFVSNSRGIIIVVEKSQMKIYDIKGIYQRITYYKLKENISKGIPTRKLLYPVEKTVNELQKTNLQKNKSILNKYGIFYEIEGNKVKIISLPDIVENQEEFIETIIDISGENLIDFILKEMATYVKIDRNLTTQSAKLLLKDYKEIGEPLFSLKGKPIFKRVELF